MNKHNKTQSYRYREQTGGYQREETGERKEIGEGDKEVQTSSYKTNEPQICNVQCAKYSQ